MLYFIRYGMNPELTVWFMVWYTQLKAAMMLVSLRHQRMTEWREHLLLTPGEQYRRYIRTGGYRP